MALVTSAEVLGWVQGDGQTPITGYDATVLTACIAAAGEAIVDYTSRFWEKTPVAAEYFDGDRASGASGEILVLRRFPLIYNIFNG